MRRLSILLIVAASLLFSATPSAAKGHVPIRRYAVITGPGLAHPIVFVAAWKDSLGGFYTSDGERFLGLASGTGATPAGRIETEQGVYVPSGVLPIDEAPALANRGPRYRLTWFSDGLDDVATQHIYPYASGGPLVYTVRSSRRALIVLFGRFQAPAHLWTGWGQATSFDLKTTLQFYGLPTVEPTARQHHRNDPGERTPTTDASPSEISAVAGAAVPPSHVRPSSSVAVMVFLAAGAIALVWATRRRRVPGAENRQTSV